MAADTVHKNQRSVERDVMDETGRRTLCLEERDNCNVCITFLGGSIQLLLQLSAFRRKEAAISSRQSLLLVMIAHVVGPANM